MLCPGILELDDDLEIVRLNRIGINHSPMSITLSSIEVETLPLSDSHPHPEHTHTRHE